MDRDVDIAESLDELDRLSAGPAEMPVENDSDIGSVEAPILATARAVTLLVRVRLAVGGQSAVGMVLVEAQSVLEERGLGSGQAGLGRHAHRRTEDSILTIMAAMIPLRRACRQAAAFPACGRSAGLSRRR